MRQLRPDFAGALHHVYNRGIDGRDIFRDDRDRSFFLEWLGSVAEKKFSDEPASMELRRS